MAEPLSRNNRVAGSIKAAVTKGQEELGRAGSEAAWTKANCPKGSRDVANNPYSRQNFYPREHRSARAARGTARRKWLWSHSYIATGL
jgi:hypothetical protein